MQFINALHAAKSKLLIQTMLLGSLVVEAHLVCIAMFLLLTQDLPAIIARNVKLKFTFEEGKGLQLHHQSVVLTADYVVGTINNLE